MKNKVMLILFFLFGIAIFATPHYPGGIPSIGPLQGGATFWGTDADGNYIDGVTYSADYDIDVPKYGRLHVEIGVTKFLSGGGESETRVSITSEKSLEDFTGEINIYTVNSSGKTIVKNYKGYLNNTREYRYNGMFDFTDADKDAKITLEFPLKNGKNLSVKLKKETAQDWIFISKEFSQTKQIK